MGHFETKSDAAPFRVYWSGAPTRADVLHLAFVLDNALRRYRWLKSAVHGTLPYRISERDLDLLVHMRTAWRLPIDREARRVHLTTSHYVLVSGLDVVIE